MDHPDHYAADSAVEQVVFLHIPKSAGTSFANLLQQRFPAEQTFPPYVPQQLARARQEEIGAYRLIRGHFFYGVMKRLLRGSPIYLTFLRDPIERALSTYAQLQNKPEVADLRPWGPGMDLEAFVFHPRASDVITNLQTRSLASEFTLDRVEEVTEATATEARDALTGKYPPAGAAMRALDELAFFGLAERFDESLALLAHTLGWPASVLRGGYASLNVSPRRPTRARLPRHVLARLVELNAEDLALYDYARRQFAQRCRQMGVVAD